MGSLTLNYFPSCDLRAQDGTNDILPYLKIFNVDLELPLPYSSLYSYNGVCFVLSSTSSDHRGVQDHLLAGCNMSVYNSKNLFRQGLYEIELHPLEPLGVRNWYELEKVIRDKSFDWKPKGLDEMNRILKVNRKHLRNELYETPLDKHILPAVERGIDEAKKTSGRLFLSVKFGFSSNHPNHSFPVIFQRQKMPPYALDDPQLEQWNPVDEKYVKMTRNARTADVDRERKPNKEDFDKLKNIMEQQPGGNISQMAGDILWRYRFYLSTKYPESSLTKFLLSVRWQYVDQVSQAVQLLEQWPSIAPEYVLDLLGPKFVHPVPRRFAVARLQEARDEELLLYLYQLVQAIRLDKPGLIHHDSVNEGQQPPSTSSRSAPNNQSSDRSNSGGDKLASQVSASLSLIDGTPPLSPSSAAILDATSAFDLDSLLPWKEDLVEFLIRRALSNFSIASYLYWYLYVETCDSPRASRSIRNLYSQVLTQLHTALSNDCKESSNWYQQIRQQGLFVDDLNRLFALLNEDSGNRQRKIQLLRKKLQSIQFPNLNNFSEPLSLPLDPTVKVVGIDAESAHLFKSVQRPALLTFNLCATDVQYKVLFKSGDDLRQDQLVLQMIELMDVILRKENFDLKLSPYKVLSTGTNQGFVQFIQSTSISDILKKGTLLEYLQSLSPSPNSPSGVNKEIMENYIRSCAGYCVITYLLGVGDRHMDNLLITPDGRLFHIDFSFIFGADPKPMAPEVRLTKPMIEVMGGANGPQFNEFWKMTLTSFLILRRHAHIFLTLFSLSPSLELPTTSSTSSTPVRTTGIGLVQGCEFLKERFCLDQSEERARNRLVNIITDSIKAIFPELVEFLHSLAQRLRN